MNAVDAYKVSKVWVGGIRTQSLPSPLLYL